MVRPQNRRRKTLSTPAHKIRFGTLQATIWRNHAENGPWYSVKLTRGSKADEGWRETDNLCSDDLLAAAIALNTKGGELPPPKPLQLAIRKEHHDMTPNELAQGLRVGDR
ncbi:MAG: hypothetical protein C0467_27700 [Planctomycetaceae bacterium]|nr:hypothetical protein [Planctomycetaceae bacterium]